VRWRLGRPFRQSPPAPDQDGRHGITWNSQVRIRSSGTAASELVTDTAVVSHDHCRHQEVPEHDGTECSHPAQAYGSGS
jgi:hypothetical protein